VPAGRISVVPADLSGEEDRSRAAAAALEAHTVNLAAELRGTGVTVNAYRPGGVDTAMQAWIRQATSAPARTSGSTETTPTAP